MVSEGLPPEPEINMNQFIFTNCCTNGYDGFQESSHGNDAMMRNICAIDP
jgi:hypothetical protein